MALNLCIIGSARNSIGIEYNALSRRLLWLLPMWVRQNTTMQTVTYKCISYTLPGSLVSGMRNVLWYILFSKAILHENTKITRRKISVEEFKKKLLWKSLPRCFRVIIHWIHSTWSFIWPNLNESPPFCKRLIQHWWTSVARFGSEGIYEYLPHSSFSHSSLVGKSC